MRVKPIRKQEKKLYALKSELSQERKEKKEHFLSHNSFYLSENLEKQDLCINIP